MWRIYHVWQVASTRSLTFGQNMRTIRNNLCYCEIPPGYLRGRIPDGSWFVGRRIPPAFGGKKQVLFLRPWTDLFVGRSNLQPDSFSIVKPSKMITYKYMSELVYEPKSFIVNNSLFVQRQCISGLDVFCVQLTLSSLLSANLAFLRMSSRSLFFPQLLITGY